MSTNDLSGSERAWLAQPIESGEHAARGGLDRPAPTSVAG